MTGTLDITVSGITLTEASVVVRRAGFSFPPIPAKFRLSGFLSSKPYRGGPIVDVVIEGRKMQAKLTRHSWTIDRRNSYEMEGEGDFPFVEWEWRSLCMAKLGQPHAERPASGHLTPLLDRILTRVGQKGWHIHRYDADGGVRFSAFKDTVLREVVAPDDLIAARALATLCEHGAV